jgi:hypothetical protein
VRGLGAIVQRILRESSLPTGRFGVADASTAPTDRRKAGLALSCDALVGGMSAGAELNSIFGPVR